MLIAFNSLIRQLASVLQDVGFGFDGNDEKKVDTDPRTLFFQLPKENSDARRFECSNHRTALVGTGRDASPGSEFIRFHGTRF